YYHHYPCAGLRYTYHPTTTQVVGSGKGTTPFLRTTNIISNMQVLKFGGTSMGSTRAIEQVCNIILHQKPQGRFAIVASAMGGVTDKLIRCGRLAGQGQEQY